MLRKASNRHLWMHNSAWHQTADEGGPLIIEEGTGIRVTDSDGKSWIDVNGGYLSVNVGYGRNEIAEAVYSQMLRLSYFPQGTTTSATIKFATKLAEISPGSLNRVFPVSGGSEANETALKIARAYHSRRGEPERYKIVSRNGSYHGGSGGVMWLGSAELMPRDDYKPSYPGMVYAPQPNPYRCEMGGETPTECSIKCAQAIDDLIQDNNPGEVAAVIAEPVSMPGGAVVPGDQYWPMLREICDKYGVLLIGDEVISGFGRTGKMFGVENWGVVPDIITVAKGVVSSYLPLGATIVKDEIAEPFGKQGNILPHIFTYSGHPASTIAGLKNIEIIENEGLVENSYRVGKYFKQQLEGLMVDHPIIGDVRGIGLILALDLVSNRNSKSKFPNSVQLPSKLNAGFKKRGLILRAGASQVINLGPPLCIDNNDVDEIVHAIDLVLWEVEGELGMGHIT